MMTQPDAFERMVQALPDAYEGFPSCTKKAEVAALLRRYYARVVRMVKGELRDTESLMGQMALVEVLAKLKEGTR